MNIMLNGEARDCVASDLATLVEELGLRDAKVATALDGDFVPARARAVTALTAGCAVEIVGPMQGG